MKKVILIMSILGWVFGIFLAKIISANEEFDHRVNIAKSITKDPCNSRILQVITPPRFSTRSQMVILAGEDYLSKEDPNNLWMIYQYDRAVVVAYHGSPTDWYYEGGTKVAKNPNLTECIGKSVW